MKKMMSVILVCSIGLLPVTMYSELKRLDEKVIAEKSIAIKKMIERHNYAVAGLVVLAGFQQLCFWLPKFGIAFGPQETLVEAKREDKVPFFTALSNGLQHTFLTSEGWHSILKYCTGEAATYFVLQKIDQTFRHPDTLKWYIKTHVPYGGTVKMIKKVIKRSKSSPIEENMLVPNRQMLLALCDQLSKHSEDICAYMEYKGSQLEGRQALMAEKMSRYIFVSSNDKLQKISAQLNSAAPDWAILLQLIGAYQADLLSYQKFFSVLENDGRDDLMDTE